MQGQIRIQNLYKPKPIYTGVEGAPPVSSSDYDSHYFTLIAVGMHPLSRGAVHINAPEPTVKPTIDPSHASNPCDPRALVAAAKLGRKITQSPGLVETWTDEYGPGLG